MNLIADFLDRSMAKSKLLASIRQARRVWAIGAIHGDLEKLEAVHDALAGELEDGDRIVYLGNSVGCGPDSVGVVDELLRFRCWFLGRPPFVHPDDLIYLRGAQEEMFQRLLQIQFAKDADTVFNWMLERGLAATLQSYGADIDDAKNRCKEGTLALTYWTSSVRERLRENPGHTTFYSQLKQAAYRDDGAVLFVSAGLDVDKPVTAQSDAFWWAGRSFESIDQPYRGFRRVVRGVDPEPRGLVRTPYTLSIDGGCGRGGNLLAVCLSEDGKVLETIEA